MRPLGRTETVEGDARNKSGHDGRGAIGRWASNLSWVPVNDRWYYSNPASIRAILAAGADPNLRRYDGWTPLHTAAAHSENPAVVAALLEAGADPAAKDRDGKTPWDAVQANWELRGTDAWKRLEPGQD